MFRTFLDGLAAHWTVIRFAAMASGCYVAWLVAFERWLEPLLRRCGGAMIGGRIVWVPVVGRFRIWGMQDHASSGLDRAAGLFGGVAVLSAALVPVVAVHAAVLGTDADATIAASGYLMSLPMLAIFVVRVLTREETPQ
jgi:hypothetical protein